MNTPGHFSWRATALSTAVALLACAAHAATPSASEALKAATETARNIEAKTGAPKKQALPPGDPCTIVSTDDVRKVFPGAKPGERNPRLEKYGMTECQWKNAAGEPVLVIQEAYSGKPRSAKSDAQGMAAGFYDPMKPASLKNVRIESFASVPVDNAAFIEVADAKRGILGSGAMLQLSQGTRGILLNAPELTQRERGEALKAFESLGRAASARLTSGS